MLQGQKIFTGKKKIYEKDQPGAQKYRSQDDFASWFAQDSPIILVVLE